MRIKVDIYAWGVYRGSVDVVVDETKDQPYHTYADVTSLCEFNEQLHLNIQSKEENGFVEQRGSKDDLSQLPLCKTISGAPPCVEN